MNEMPRGSRPDTCLLPSGMLARHRVLSDSRRVTPRLRALYDQIVSQAARPPFAERSQQLRAAFAERCGSFEPGEPAAELREQAAWEDALTHGGLAREVAPRLADPEARQVASALLGALRGVFLFETVAGAVVARDLWSGAELLVSKSDSIARELVAPALEAGSQPCQARLLATLDGCVVLPGVLFHPADALAGVQGVMTAAHQRQLDADHVFDALLRMEQRWRTLSRVKVTYAYRAEFLGA